MTFAMARSSRPASAKDARERLGTSTSTAPRAAPMLRSAAGTTSSSPIGDGATLSAPVWSRLMSSRLPTSASRRSVSSSIVARNLPLGGRPVDLVVEQRRHRGLDPGQRRAEVVRDGREDGEPELVGALELAGLRGLGLELLDVDRAGELARRKRRAGAAPRSGIAARRARARASSSTRDRRVPCSAARPASGLRRATRRSCRCQSATPSSAERRGGSPRGARRPWTSPRGARASRPRRARAGPPRRAAPRARRSR